MAKPNAAPVVFLVATAAFIGLIIALQRPLPASDLYAHIPEGQFASYGPMTTAENYAAKISHAQENERYKTGVFGNSRSLMLSNAQIHPKSRPFFNFSVAGQSLRTSVLMLEELVAAGNAPRVALVSFDHAELEFFQNPDTGGIIHMLRRAWRDIRLVFDSRSPTAREWLRMAWRHIFTGYNRVLLYLDAEQFLRGLNWHWRGLWRDDPWRDEMRVNSNHGNRRDGSRSEKLPRKPIDIPIMKRVAPSIIAGYLAHDLHRLGVIQKKGVRVIVYESPLEPKSGAYFKTSPSPHAKIIRRFFMKTCQEAGLECHPFQVENLSAGIAVWANSNHAPAAVLGAYIRPFIDKAASGVAR
jgi:hypothetical protein